MSVQSLSFFDHKKRMEIFVYWFRRRWKIRQFDRISNVAVNVRRIEDERHLLFLQRCRPNPPPIRNATKEEKPTPVALPEILSWWPIEDKSEYY